MTGRAAKHSRRAAILATGSCLPPTVVSNQEIIAAHGHGVTATAVRKIYGVERRHVAETGLADSDLLAQAARMALECAGRRPEDLSKMLVTKFLGDRLLPMTASPTQKKLGSSLAFQALDVDGGSNAFLQALEAAASAIAMGDDLVLVTSGGIHNRIVSRQDPRLAFLYGDGAGAVLLGLATPEMGASRIEASYQLSDASALDFARGFELRKMSLDLHQTKDYGGLLDLYQGGDWRGIQDKVVDMVGRIAREVLANAQRSLLEMDLVLLTENHHRVWAAVLDHLGVAREKTVSLVEECGNTMSAMLPLQLDHAIAQGRLQRGQRVLLLSIGEGLSCGGMVITY
jgi:3-oxoacyl-[acyl-carrier-protein] synthase III